MSETTNRSENEVAALLAGLPARELGQLKAAMDFAVEQGYMGSGAAVIPPLAVTAGAVGEDHNPEPSPGSVSEAPA